MAQNPFPASGAASPADIPFSSPVTNREHAASIGEVSIAKVLDEHPISRLQWQTLALCLMVTVMDGFDTQTIGFLAPVIAKSLSLALPSFGAVFTAGLLGLLVGALTLGPLADRLGRKKMLIVATLDFGLCAAATAFATTLPELLLARFVTGLGLGGAIPNVMALTAEFAPPRLSRVFVTTLCCGMPAGAVIGAAVTSALLPEYGWKGPFVVGGIAPVLAAFAIALWMPESVRYLLTRPGGRARARHTMLRIAPDLEDKDVQFVSGEAKSSRPSMSLLFREGRAPQTILLWVPYVLNMMVLYFTVSWLPAVLVTSGHPISLGIQSITWFSIGGIVGSVVQGKAMDRFGSVQTLTAEFVGYMILVIALATQPLGIVGILAVATLIGIVVQGAQAGLNSLAAEIYPTVIRGTGIGCAMAVGRIGSLSGPIAGTVMLSLHWSSRDIFIAGAIPGALAAAAVVASRRFNHR